MPKTAGKTVAAKKRNTASAGKKATKSRSGSGFFRRCLYAAALSLTLVLIFCCIFIFSYGKSYPVPSLTLADCFVLNRAGRQFNVIYNARPGVKEIVILTPAEVSALMHCGSNVDTAAMLFNGKPLISTMPQQPGDNVNYAFSYDSGKVHFAYLHPLITGCLGVEFSGEAVPDYRNGRLTLSLTNCYLGRVPLPSKLLTKIANRLIEKQLQQNPELGIYLDIFEDISIDPDNGNWRIIYYPDKAKMLLL